MNAIANNGAVEHTFETNRPRSPLRRSLITIGVILVVGALALPGTVVGVRLSVRGAERDLTSVTRAPVALVLGAGLRPDGSPSPYLRNRLDAARAMYENGTIKAVLVSGDNSSDDYNEVDSMRTWLVDHGVPDTRIVSDHAGFDTHDSCVRAKKIFGVEQAIVVTQTYHLPRALFSCRAAGIDVQGVGVPTAGGTDPTGYERREWPATIKAVLDAVIGREPYFLGPRETSLDDIVGSA